MRNFDTMSIMELKSIILIFVIFVILYFVFTYIFGKSSTLSGLQSGNQATTIDASSVSNSSNFAYSIWIYVQDWNYSYGKEKPILSRSGVAGITPCPSISLASSENSLIVRQSCYKGDTPSNKNVSTTEYNTDTFYVSNIPIQTWTNIIVSVNNRVLDIYIDGKFVRSEMLSGVPYVDGTLPVYITPNGGFSGYTSTFQYFSSAMDPQKAWSIYTKGYGNTLWNSIFGGTQVNVNVTRDGISQATFKL